MHFIRVRPLCVILNNLKLSQTNIFIISTSHLQVWRGFAALWFSGKHKLRGHHSSSANDHSAEHDTNCSDCCAGMRLWFDFLKNQWNSHNFVFCKFSIKLSAVKVKMMGPCLQAATTATHIISASTRRLCFKCVTMVNGFIETSSSVCRAM